MKRRVASRKLIRKCIYCNKGFYKGDVYYINRKVAHFNGELYADEWLICARCKYYQEDKAERYKKFVESETCRHPVTSMIYTTIAGEDYVQEPSHEECDVCGRKV